MLGAHGSFVKKFRSVNHFEEDGWYCCTPLSRLLRAIRCVWTVLKILGQRNSNYAISAVKSWHGPGRHRYKQNIRASKSVKFKLQRNDTRWNLSRTQIWFGLKTVGAAIKQCCFDWLVLFHHRKEKMRAAVPSVKDPALHPALCATEASFQCWQTDLRSPTELCDVPLVMKMACNPARPALHDCSDDLASTVSVSSRKNKSLVGFFKCLCSSFHLKIGLIMSWLWFFHFSSINPKLLHGRSST